MAKDTEWTVLFHQEFDTWLAEQEQGLRREIWSHIDVLRRLGPNLGRPRVGTIKGSAFSNMKELVIQYQGNPWRVLFAFDPNRNAVLLVGGTKVGKKDWYAVHIPIADQRFERYLKSLKGQKKG
jgi:hypothetical protein